MKAHMIRKMGEVIQKQRNQSLNIQKQSLKGVFIKRCFKYAVNLQQNNYCEVWFPFPCRGKGLLLKLGLGLWTWTIKNLDSGKPGPKTTWTLENMNPGKYGVNMGAIKKYV